MLITHPIQLLNWFSCISALSSEKSLFSDTLLGPTDGLKKGVVVVLHQYLKEHAIEPGVQENTRNKGNSYITPRKGNKVCKVNPSGRCTLRVWVSIWCITNNLSSWFKLKLDAIKGADRGFLDPLTMLVDFPAFKKSTMSSWRSKW